MAQSLNNREENLISYTNHLVQANAYFYTIWKGFFVVRLGDVFETKYANYRSFRTKDSKRYACAHHLAEVYNNGLWFPFRDDALAAEILIKHEQEAIQELNDKIKDRQLKIAILTGGVNDETPQDNCS